MSRKLIVDPTKLEDAAQKMAKHADTYENLYVRLFEVVDGVEVAWQGADNLTFVKQIRSVEKEFQRNTKFMREYSDFLKFSAKTYRDVQNDSIANAKGLIS